MVQTGHPVPTTVTPAIRAKISDGQSVVVTAPAGGTVSGLFYLVGGWFGAAFSTVTAGLTVALNIEQAEFEATAGQVTGAFTAGALLYWDPATSRFTATVGTNRLVGRVTEVLAGNVPRFILFEQRG